MTHLRVTEASLLASMWFSDFCVLIQRMPGRAWVTEHLTRGTLDMCALPCVLLNCAMLCHVHYPAAHTC